MTGTGTKGQEGRGLVECGGVWWTGLSPDGPVRVKKTDGPTRQKSVSWGDCPVFVTPSPYS